MSLCLLCPIHGCSINPEIDVGQVEGAFTMGLGYWLTEKLIFDKDSGQLLTHNTWVNISITCCSVYVCMLCFVLQEYKPPASKDIPIDFRIALLKNAPNPIGILGSKGMFT